MSTQIQIINKALIKLGADTILSLSDNSKQARTMSAIYDSTRDRLLRRYNWRFAMVRTALAALATTPEWGYTYEYSLPSDCLRVEQVGEQLYGDYSTGSALSEQTELYAIEGNKILTDLSAPLSIRYVSRITDTSKYDASFSDAFSFLLAIEGCEAITQNSNKREIAWKEYKEIIREAVVTNAIEKYPQSIPDTTWITVRL